MAESLADYDYIVVGAGAAGCVVASRLAERRHRVALLEAGEADASPLFRIPGLGFLVAVNPRYNWMFQTEPVAGLNGRALTMLQGRVVGGSSSINGMMYNRGHPGEYALWRQLGCEGWTYDEVLPYFRKVEDHLAGLSATAGAAATPLRKSAPRLPILDAFLASAGALGYPALDDLANGRMEGFGYYYTNIQRGRRISAASAYLRPALGSGFLALQTGAEVLRVVFEGRRAAGVEMMHRGEKKTLRAASEVILCGGGIKSPHLLLLSGIGPAEHLRAFGIDVIADSPGVGRNLQNHPCFRMQFACRAPASAYRYAKPLGALGAGLDYAFGRSGPLAQTIYSAGGFLRTSPDMEIPDIQVVLAGALTPSPAQMAQGWRGMLPKAHGFTAVIYQGTPYSTGRVSLQSADGLARPRIDPGYFSDPRDVDTLVEGMRRVRQIAKGEAMRQLGVEEISPGVALAEEKDLREAVRQGAGTAYHQSGTCAMGGDVQAVVDPLLRVRGVEGLRVADASVMPRVPNAGLHGPTLMIGERAADFIARG